jgi:hypothetical protein
MIISNEELLDICLTLVSVGGSKYLTGPVQKVIEDRVSMRFSDKKKIAEEVDRMLFFKDIELMARDGILNIDNSNGYVKMDFTELGLQKLREKYEVA